MQRSNLSLLLGIVLVVAASPVAEGQQIQLTGRAATPRDRLLRLNGWNAESEAALARGLAWLSRQHLEDGSWKFDGSSTDKVAATGLALLPFLAVDQAPTGNDKYSKVVKKGLQWLLDQLDKDGAFKDTRSTWAQSLGTIALCDAATLAKDDKLQAKAALAVKHIVESQATDGTWGVRRRKPVASDALAIGWQIQALDSARRAGIEFDKGSVYGRSDKFLKSLSTDMGATYGKSDDVPSETLTSIGLLSRLLMGRMKSTDPAFQKGVGYLKERPPQGDLAGFDYYYFATRVMFANGGDDWHKFWNPKMRDSLIDLMMKGGADATRGSWLPDTREFGDLYGRHGTTCLSVLILEVYHRYQERPKNEEPKK